STRTRRRPTAGRRRGCSTRRSRPAEAPSPSAGRGRYTSEPKRRSPPMRTPVLVLALAASPLTTAAADIHSDGKHDFRFTTPREFSSIAIEPSERVVVARYQKETKDFTPRGTYHHATLELLRFGEKRDGGVPTGEEVWASFDDRYSWKLEKERSLTNYGVNTAEKTFSRGDYLYLLVVVPHEDAG